MKALWPVLLGFALTACGAQVAAPGVDQLLGAPTALNVGGQVLTVGTAPAASSQGFGVKVRLASARTPLPAVRLDGVFVVSGSALWKSPLSSAGDGQGSAWGRNVSAWQPGEPVQVVVRLKDERGRVLWLRGPQTRVGQAP
ncbi:hypothetical protein GO986_07525 [Deinococcus sp. HMF7620]|uniref:Uncharacterized protein n=1 Tax=Deinococcus arboris TaxID=2682977 RepID=A0A7C9HR72_9DEIO|nr:hypothetical protein [Deinococcus arboris]MVN86613.1 hypothetical protein [Deinococcus arboris]